MLTGEYAVLNGGTSLAFTVNRHLNVTATATPGTFRVESDLWDEVVTFGAHDIHQDQNEPLLDAVYEGARLTGLTGASFKITSELNVRFGLGSSSALRLGVLLACRALTQADCSSADGTQPVFQQTAAWDMARVAWLQQRRFQTQASGYDIATQLAGGLVRMSPQAEAWPGTVERLPDLGENLSELIHVFVGGAGAATKAVTLETAAWIREECLHSDIQALSEALEEQFCAAFTNLDDDAAIQELCSRVGRHRRLFRRGPHFPIRLAQSLEAIAGLDDTWSYKTTGAGGEDAVLVIGRRKDVHVAKQALLNLGWSELHDCYQAHGAMILNEVSHES